MVRIEDAEEVPALPPTGERMVPESSDPGTFWEHIYRYRFAARFARGKRVLDIACGEGYGSSALLKSGASSLVGVDVSREACEHARRKYGIDAREGDARNIPLPDGSIDLIVSFETIEHVPDPGRFLDECARVLAPGGMLVVSTPNRDIYRQITTGGSNPYHCAEMDLKEFEDILKPRFRRWSMYTQVSRRARWYQPGGMAVESWFWWRLRGFRKFYRHAKSTFSGHLFREPSVEDRLEPQKAILRPESPLAAFFNPFAIRAKGRLDGEDPIYLLAVAHID